MIVLLFNIIILVVGILTLYNFRAGYLAIFCSKILIPHMVRFGIGSLSLSIADVFSLILIVSFIFHRTQLTKGKHYPLILKKYFIIEIVITLLLIILSSGYVPYSYQFTSFIKTILQTFVFMWLGYWAFTPIANKRILNIIFIVLIGAGFYGILSYLIKFNPYVDLLYIVYSGEENIYSIFMDEERGGLVGRTSGTMTHPLGWGQMWNLVIGLYFLYNKNINKFLGFIIVVIGIINIIFCGSRAAIVALVILYIFYLFSLSRKKVFKNLFIILSLLTMGFFAFRKNENIEKVSKYIQAAVFFWDQEASNEAEIRGSSVNMRIRQFEVSIEKAASSIGGLGYNYQLYTLNNYRKADDELYGLESVIFKKFVEQGFIGMIVFIYTTTLLLKYARRNEKHKEKVLITGFFCSYIATISITGIQGETWPLFFVIILLFKNRNKISNNCYDS